MPVFEYPIPNTVLLGSVMVQQRCKVEDVKMGCRVQAGRMWMPAHARVPCF